jgi:hypothetical protein|tara:strand:+ start:206 stop:577 length:372 start_codon:yes stop_codon:yes gene_type:complete
MTKHEELQEKFPFLTGIEFSEEEFVGIVQNKDAQILSFYDIEKCRNDDEKKLLLELGDLWWWESNRLLPIDVFLFKEMQDFRHCLRTFVLKETEVLFGPVTSMQNILKKRIKRRTVQLVKKVD